MSDDKEPDLFSWEPPPRYPDVPVAKTDGTSQEAADAIADRAPTLRDQALAILREEALTADEVAARMDCRIWSIRPRITELKLLGLVADTGERRLNISGRRAEVVRAATKQ